MNKYRVTAKLAGNTDDIFLAEVEADNEDEAWAIAYKSQLPRGIYNGKVEELPTREEQAAKLARYQAIATAAREVIDGQPLGDTAPDDFIANFRIRLGAIRQLAAALAALEQETK